MPEHLHDLDDVAAELDVDLVDKQPVTVEQLLDLLATLDGSGDINTRWTAYELALDSATDAVRFSYYRLRTALTDWGYLTPAERVIFDARIAREDRPSR